MAVKQTSIQKADTIRFGSGKFEVSTDDSTWIDLGAMRNVAFRESWEELLVESDNAGQVKIGIRNQKASLEGDLLEINLTNLNTLRGGIDVYSTQAGTPVSGATYAKTSGNWGYNDPIVVEYQNYDGSQLTINSVTGSVDGALVEDTDFFVGQDAAGDTIVTIIDSATVTTESQTMTIDYDYTPAASKTLKSGGKFTMAERYVRITNTDEDGDTFIIKIFAATSKDGIEIELQPDEGEDAATMAIKMEGTLKDSLTEGEQLFEIVDAQNIT